MYETEFGAIIVTEILIFSALSTLSETVYLRKLNLEFNFACSEFSSTLISGPVKSFTIILKLCESELPISSSNEIVIL